MKQIFSLRYAGVMLCIFLSTALNAQIKTRIYQNKIPISLLPLKSTTINLFTLKTPSQLDSLLKTQNDGNDKSIEYDNKFAIPQSVNIDFLASAKIYEDQNDLFYYLTIKAIRP